VEVAGWATAMAMVPFWHGTEVYSSKLTSVKQTLTANEIRLPVGGSFGRTAELSASTKSWPTRAELARHRDAWLHDYQVINVRQRTDANDKFP